ncbi:nucleotidyltransferase domain-containing protein [Halosimplex pelagicum]|uniref:Nucleotidyltransferase domain-containing protein n=1 Tax=Halosimplex pelagicum TaxID=869886 RepID=A0A7D5TEK5_9EURY|nr:nucleotidyltransferase domain-containing protein [Halosimplex pelagicum]QLH84833.1 nucleotidyltransferase domain-containing protein [Halosimplex pelagicum]
MAESTLPHRDAVDAFVDRVEEWGPSAVARLYLFGSVARGGHRSDSDVDVFAVLRDDADASAVEERLRDVAYDVMLERDVAFSIHAMSESTVAERSDHPFVRSVLDEGTRIYG